MLPSCYSSDETYKSPNSSSFLSNTLQNRAIGVTTATKVDHPDQTKETLHLQRGRLFIIRHSYRNSAHVVLQLGSHSFVLKFLRFNATFFHVFPLVPRTIYERKELNNRGNYCCNALLAYNRLQGANLLNLK